MLYARETVHHSILQHETTDFIAPDLCPPNSATPYLRLPSYSWRDGQAELIWVAGDNRDSLLARRRSPIRALTGPSVQ